MTAPRIFIYVQHLLGIGHLKRAAALARAASQAGAEVTLASGGPPVAGIALGGARLAQLPPASAADLTFKVMHDAAGRPIDENWKRARAAALLAAWRAAQAQVLLIELFPFGRRQMRFELLPLIEAAAAAPRPPAIACSVRDILGGAKSAERQAETLELLRRRYDHVLVHGDAAVVGFEETFPPAAQIAAKLHYTGYVVDAPAAAQGDAGRGEVLVSAGGGAVGAPLLEAALRAKPATALRDRTWRVLAGDNLPEDEFRALGRLAAQAPGVVLERSRRDFTTLLANCELSVSQAGYNTLLESMQLRARAVVVPFARGQETEQTLRARRFAARGLLEMVEEAALTPAALAQAIDRAAARPRPAAGALALEGAAKSAALLLAWARERMP
jgi:predicted glycosyltransferase